jgi:hypothetical protein
MEWRHATRGIRRVIHILPLQGLVTCKKVSVEQELSEICVKHTVLRVAAIEILRSV